MITNFEGFTYELTEYERKILQPRIVKGLSVRIGKDKAITNSAMCKALSDKGYDISEPRLRKIIHSIRIQGLIPLLLSTSKGYFVADNDEQIKNWCESMQQRINSQAQILKAIKEQYGEKQREYCQIELDME